LIIPDKPYLILSFRLYIAVVGLLWKDVSQMNNLVTSGQDAVYN